MRSQLASTLQYYDIQNLAVMGLAFLKLSSGNREKAGEFYKVSVIVLGWGKRHFRHPPTGNRAGHLLTEDDKTKC